MAFTDSGDGSPADTGGPDSNGTAGGGGPGSQAPGTQPEPAGGPMMAALQRQVTGPQVSSPGPGNMADSLGKLKIALDLMQSALHGFDSTSSQYKDVEKALDELTKHLPETGAQSALEETHLMDLMRKSRQNPVLQAISRTMGTGGIGGQGRPQPPMPSTPLPGA